MPFGIGLGPQQRAVLALDRELLRPASTSPPKAMPMPSALGNVRAPSEKFVPGTVASRMKNMTTSRSTVGKR